MNHEQTRDKLNGLKLYGMLQVLETHYPYSQPTDLTPQDFLSLLVDSECTYRDNKRMKRLIQVAQFKEKEASSNLSITKAIED